MDTARRGIFVAVLFSLPGIYPAHAQKQPPLPSENPASHVEHAQPRGRSTDEQCTPGYDPCIPPGADVDCAGGSGDGPRYVDGPIHVTGSDPYRLDRDRDGVGCE